MRYGSVCSGIEAASVAWHPLGWEPAWFAEIEAFPSAVLAHRFPGVPNHGDFTRLLQERPADVDVLVGGTPCQSFSVAGLRGGLADPRGNLALAFVALVGVLRPRWVVWENVPGVLSSGGGRDFGSFLGGLGELGYGWAYRVLDAQWFGLAQRRKRVFVVAHSGGDWRRAAAALFEPEGLRRDSPPRRRSGEGVAGSLGTGASDGGGWRVGADEAAAGHVVPAPRVGGGGGASGRGSVTGYQVLLQNNGDGGYRQVLGLDEPHPTLNLRNANAVASGGNNTAGPIEVATAVNAKGGTGRADFESETFVAYQCQGSNVGPMGTLRKGNGDVTGGRPFIAHAFDARQQDVVQYGDKTGPLDTDPGSIAVAHTLRGTGHDASEDGTGRGAPLVPAWMPSRTLAKDGGIDERFAPSEVCNTLHTRSQNGNKTPIVYGVRRLSCVEMERLQGFPDGWTLIPYGPARKRIEADEAAYLRRHWPHLGDDEIRRLAKDGPRAKALGNSMAVPCMAWIGARIALLDRERP